MKSLPIFLVFMVVFGSTSVSAAMRCEWGALPKPKPLSAGAKAYVSTVQELHKAGGLTRTQVYQMSLKSGPTNPVANLRSIETMSLVRSLERFMPYVEEKEWPAVQRELQRLVGIDSNSPISAKAREEADKFLAPQETEILPPEAQPEVPGKWETFVAMLKSVSIKPIFYRAGQKAGVEEHARQTAIYETYKMNLNLAREATTTSYQRFVAANFQNKHLDPAYHKLKNELATTSVDLIGHAVTEQQLQRILLYLMQQAEGILTLSRNLQADKEAAALKLSTHLKPAGTDLVSKAETSVATLAIESVKKANSKDEIDVLLTNFESELQEARANAEAEMARRSAAAEAERIRLEAIRQRRLAELRFDAHDQAVGETVLRALLNLELGPTLNEEQLHQLMRRAANSLSVRKFLVEELQILRRLKMKADALKDSTGKAIMAGAAYRLQNDLSVLLDERELNEFLVLQDLRRRAIVLNSRRMFRGLTDIRGLRRMNQMQREALVMEALRNENLKMTMITASLDLRQSLAPPRLPDKPGPAPAQPDIPRKVKTRAQANAAQEKHKNWVTAYKAWLSRVEAFNYAVKQFNENLVPAHKRNHQRLREAYSRRQSAREAYLAYMSMHHPEGFVSPAIAGQISDRAKRQAQARLQTLPESTRQFVRRRAEESRASYGPDAFDWSMCLLTGNPVWLLNRTIAMQMMMWDFIFFSLDGRNSSALAASMFGVTEAETQTGFLERHGSNLDAQLQPLAQTYEKANADMPAEFSAPLAPIDTATLTPEERAAFTQAEIVPAAEAQALATDMATVHTNAPDLVDPVIALPTEQLNISLQPIPVIEAVSIPSVQIETVPSVTFDAPRIQVDTGGGYGGGGGFTGTTTDFGGGGFDP